MHPRAVGRGGMERMTTNPWGLEGYGPATYGDAFADVYDERYTDFGDDGFVDLLLGLLPDGGSRVLELGVGTGRLLSRLAAVRGEGLDELHGVDTSDPMLERARSAPHLGAARLSRHDFSVSLPEGPFDLVFCGWNTFMMLPDVEAVSRAINLAAGVLGSGALAIDLTPPHPKWTTTMSGVELDEMTADKVTLWAYRYDPETRRVNSQYVEIAHGAAPVLRPTSVLYVPVEMLDELAGAAGLHLVHRSADGQGAEVTEETRRVVSVWRRP